MSTTQLRLLTAEEYGGLPDPGYPTELVRGEIVRLSRPKPRHGKILIRVGRLLGDHVEERDLGHVLGGDSGFVTERDPDSVRGPDVCFYRYERLARDADLELYPEIGPNVLFEIHSPSDRWSEIVAKADECLAAGTDIVCLLDPRQRTATLFAAGAAPRELAAGEPLTFAGLPGWTTTAGELLGPPPS